MHPVIAIDGPAASGKSSTARAVAEVLGFRQADSGAFYRAATAARLRRGGDPETWTEKSVVAAAGAVTVEPADGQFVVRIDGAAVDAELRGAAVTSQVSRVARMGAVRVWVNAQMRGCARLGPIVVDGRDMGSDVFPEAVLKVWLVASARERARRRSLQILGRAPTDAELDAETASLVARDARDAAQTRPASDAVELDTTHVTQAEQVAQIIALARARIAP